MPILLQMSSTLNDIVADGSVCVVYVDGKVALSNRIYGLQDKQWGIIADGTNATFSDMELLSP
ncbi:DUF4975 domain-containing protein [Pedobacter sp. BS3]|uniref:glycoside hydrolase domain-containing protein n=1 Tax=Pedobacter sp. BS3 TaxID=2567937 RepID=UPI0011ECFCA8|nr:glycoside hydrolase domain-containing protein [Pedobacter sp. BS3]TZF82085.1 DUF4975 domain-containing protein [Pedobacter sp. BS3]